MSHDDPYRPDRDRGAYTPPTDDELPFNRGGGFDARPRGGTPVGGGGRPIPVALLVSLGVLVVIIIGAVVAFSRAGPGASKDAPVVGEPVPQMKVAAPVDAQPVDPAEGLEVYSPSEPVVSTAPPVFAPPPETPAPRPASPAEPAPAKAVTPPVKTVEPAPAPASTAGNAGVQIGAFSTPGIADREYAALAARYPQFASRASKRVQEVTASNGSTVYRTTFAGLSPEDARAFCAAIRASGGDCIIR